MSDTQKFYAREIKRLIADIKIQLLNSARSLRVNLIKGASGEISIDKSLLVNANSAIKINLGMLNLLENEDELAGVIGHELSHRLLDFSDGLFDDLDSIFSNDRKLNNPELSADQLGTFLIIKAGYNPFALRNVLQRIATHPRYKPNPSGGNTHPAPADRVKNLENYLHTLGLAEKNPVDSPRFRQSIAMLHQEKSVDTVHEQKISEALKAVIETVKFTDFTSVKQKKEKLSTSLNLLSKIFIDNPQLRPLRDRALHAPELFLSGILEIASPLWLSEREIIEGKILAAFEEITKLLLSLAPYVGDAIDLHELISGKSFFDGSELTAIQRILSGVGIIIGSRRIFEGAETVSKKIVEDMAISGESAKVFSESEKVAVAIEELGWKGSRESIQDVSDVATSLRKTGRLPEDYISLEEAERLGWKKKEGNLWEVAPNKQIGGEVYLNKNKKLPEDTYYEADIGYRGGYRGRERVVYSQYGERIYLTNDHYETFMELK